MSHSRTAYEAVIIAILKDDKVLLHKRKNTGWMDGWLVRRAFRSC